MRERDIEMYLVARVGAMGGITRKVAWVNRRGAPDRVVMMPGGRMFWVELKAPGQTLAPHQMRERDMMAKMGQTMHVIDSAAGVDELLS